MHFNAIQCYHNPKRSELSRWRLLQQPEDKKRIHANLYLTAIQTKQQAHRKKSSNETQKLTAGSNACQTLLQ